MAAAGELTPICAEAGGQIFGTLLGVAQLYDPAVMGELEVTAVA